MALFSSDAIDGIVKQALEHNRTVKAAVQTLAESQELALAQAGLRYPQVGLTAGAGREQYGAELFGGGFDLPPFTTNLPRPTKPPATNRQRSSTSWRFTAATSIIVTLPSASSL